MPAVSLPQLESHFWKATGRLNRGKPGDIFIYDQESNATARHLAIMNLASRGVEADAGTLTLN